LQAECEREISPDSIAQYREIMNLIS